MSDNYENKYVVIRKPSLQEDGKRHRMYGFFDTYKECEAFIEESLQGYWLRDEFIISAPVSQPNKCGDAMVA